MSASRSKPIRMLVVDDHPGLLAGIAAMLGCEPDMTVVGEAVDGEEPVIRHRELQPDVVLMDV